MLVFGIGKGAGHKNRRASSSIVLPWTPSQLGAAGNWWDPSSGVVLNGANVQSWTDKNNSEVFNQATAANQPAYSAAGLESLPNLFSNTTGKFLANIALSSGFDIANVGVFTILRPSTNANLRFITSSSIDGTARIDLYIDSGGKPGYNFSNGDKIAEAVNHNNLTTILGAWSAGGIVTPVVNGTPGTPTATGASKVSTMIGLGTYAVNANAVTLDSPLGDVIYVRNPTQDISNKITRFLATKYNRLDLLPGGFP